MDSHYPPDIEKYIRSNVLLGKEGFLFLWQGSQNQFNYLTGLSEPSKTSIRNFSQNIRSRRLYLDKFGIQYKHIVFPSKPTICSEQFPVDLKVTSLYKSYYAEFDYVSYPRDALLYQRSKGKKVFRTLDTHLTDYGFLTCLKDALPNDFQNLKSNGYTYKSVQKQLAGDLEYMIHEKNQNTVAENIMKPFDSYGAPILSEEADNIKDLEGNTGNIVILKSLNSLKNQRLLIFGDSFIRKGLHLLSPLYNEIIYFRSQYFRPEIVNVLRPNVVLTANAERYLSNVQNDQETEFWCTSNFIKSTVLASNKDSKRVLYHLRGLSSKYFDNDHYQTYINDTSQLLKIDNVTNKIPFQKWVKDERQRSLCHYYLERLKHQDFNLYDQIKLKPVSATSPSNGTIRSLANFVYRADINHKKKILTPLNNLLNVYDKKELTILCLLRLENIFIKSKNLALDNFEASELYLVCNILANLLDLEDKHSEGWIIRSIDTLIRQESKIYLAEILKACYLFQPYLMLLKLSLPKLVESIDSRSHASIKKYFENIKKLEPANSEFVELIKDKSVAIVGPSSCGQSLGQEIDQFDTVIRMSVDNFMDLDKVVTGVKTTISYFSGHISKSQDRIISLSDTIPCVSISLPKFAPLLFKKVQNSFKSRYPHVRQTIPLKYVSKLQLYTSPNLLQVILIDLLGYNPSKVKVFYSNMFAKNTYDSNYKSVKGLRQRAGVIQQYTLSSLTMLNHDPISNYLLIKSLYKHNFFEADPVLASVLNMNLEQYLLSLESSITINQED